METIFFQMKKDRNFKKSALVSLLFLSASFIVSAQFPQTGRFTQRQRIFNRGEGPQSGFPMMRRQFNMMPMQMPDMTGMFGGMKVTEGPELQSKVDFESSNLPIVIIDTDGETINSKSKIAAHMKVINNGEGKRNNIVDHPNCYDGNIGIKLRGNSSLSFNQKKYTIETRDDFGKDLDTPLLGLPPESDWVLLAPYNDVSMIRDVIAFHIWNEMGHWGPHTRMCEVVVNGCYRGVYILSETIKISPNRLDIAKLKESDNEDRELTGGYILRLDVHDSQDKTFVSPIYGVSSISSGGFGGMGGGFTNVQSVVWTCYKPGADKITDRQYEYIKDYVGKAEVSIEKDEDYSLYIDISSFIDYFIHTELSLNADGFKRSAYFYKTKQKEDGNGGKLHAGPVWDYNLAYGNCNFCNAGNIYAWVYEGCETNPTPAMWKTLSQDPKFMKAVKARYSELRKTLLSEKSIYSFIDKYAILLDEAQKRHFTQYSNLLKSEKSDASVNGWSWFTVGGGATFFSAYTVADYQEEIGTLKKWFAERLSFLDKNWN